MHDSIVGSAVTNGIVDFVDLEGSAGFEMSVSKYDIIFPCIYADCRGELCDQLSTICPDNSMCYEDEIENVEASHGCECDDEDEFVSDADICIPGQPDKNTFVHLVKVSNTTGNAVNCQNNICI